MSKLDFIKKLYNGKNCYSDHMTEEELKLLHISSKVENLICEMLRKGKIVFLTGNPGDGKTFIIKAIKDVIASTNAYTKFDMNSETEYVAVAREIAALSGFTACFPRGNSRNQYCKEICNNI